MKLYNFQQKAVATLKQMLKEHNGVILRADEGLGKTIMAYNIIPKGEAALLVAPAKAVKDIQQKLTSYAADNIDVISYHAFGNTFDSGISNAQLRRYNYVIFDECHYLRNYTASWTQRFVRLRSFGRKFLFMSATPLIKSPRDYVYVLRKTGIYGSMTTTEFYERYFDAKKSRYGDFLEFGPFRNKEDFRAHLERVSIDICQEDVAPYMPGILFNFIELNYPYAVAKKIQEETQVRLKNGLAKVAAYDPMKRTTFGLYLCHFHEVGKALAKKLNIPFASTHKQVQDCIKQFNKEKLPGFVTTLGLTNSSLDFNKCNVVTMFESNYSWALDRQSFKRCYRLGKKEPLHVHYVHNLFERPLLTAIKNKANLEMNPDAPAHSKLGPSSLALLEQCPGSYWIDDHSPNPHLGAAAVGTLLHDSAEHLINNPHIPIPDVYKDTIANYVEHCRGLAELAEACGAEQRLSFKDPALSIGDQRVEGTVDFYAIVGKVLHVIDYKNGRWPVSPEKNLQLLAYSAMIEEDIPVKRVYLKIFQRKKYKCWKVDILTNNVKGRIKKIIERIRAAKDKPLEHLNEGPCSPFCSARNFHKEKENG